MLLYNLRLALLSLRRTPLLSVLTVVGIALGIGVAITFIAIRHLFVADPVPAKSHVLHYVRVDSWDPAQPFPGRSERGAPPIALTYGDADALRQSPIPARATLTFPARMLVDMGRADRAPFSARVRVCGADFFAMMDVPLRFGAGWDADSEAKGDAVAVIGHGLNEKVFGGRDSVGQSLRLDGRDFTVVGVLAPWRPFLRYWDVINSPLADPEEVYLPFTVARAIELDNGGNDYGWGADSSETYEDYLASESCWVGLWVELPDADARAAYESFVAGYVSSQKELGRFARPMNNRVTPLLELLDEQAIIPEQISALTIVSLLFLVLCILNVVGLLVGKFLARACEAGTRRALGASRWAIFVQHMVECELIGLLGGLLGLGTGTLLLAWVNNMPHGLEFHLNGEMLLVTVLLSLVAGLCAGIYPAWRVAALEPALFLKDT